MPGVASLARRASMLLVLAACSRAERLNDTRAAINDNTTGAGDRSGDTLSVRLVASMTRWFPSSDTAGSLRVAAFGEEGKQPSVPAPLIRVPVGTLVKIRVRNDLADTLLVVGLTGAEGAGRDTLRLAPGASDSTSALVRTPGSFAYYGYTQSAGKLVRLGPGEQLFGAFIVDSLRTPVDRVMVIHAWNDTGGVRFVLAINGRTWPHTERLALDPGDTLRLRVINGSDGNHPMHLHGFYYDVLARGSWHADTALPPAQRKTVVTETLERTQTMSLAWTPTRAGNWLFHCHDAFHIEGKQHAFLAGVEPSSTHDSHDPARHLQESMAGLVMAITVRGDARVTLPSPGDRRLRLLALHDTSTGMATPYGYAIDTTGSARTLTASVPGSPLVLRRGERTAITVVNRLPEPTAVHWHGLEIESYYDGVAGWSGSGQRVAPLLAPNDSFVALLVPPRSGTFIYHAHASDERQIPLGLAGPLIVLDPGAVWRPDRDHVLFFTQDGIGDSAAVVLNGRVPPDTLRAGVQHRLRIVNITGGDMISLELRGASDVVSWRPVAKDGADLPAHQAREGPARLRLGAGEVWDMLWTPRRGDYVLNVDSFNRFSVPVVVRE